MLTGISVNLLGVGGQAPYTFAVVTGSGTDIAASITGAVLTVNAAAVPPGNYSVEVSITDSSSPVPQTSSIIIPVQTVLSSESIILNTDIFLVPSSSSTPQSVALTAHGVLSTGLNWSLDPTITTLPGASINYAAGPGWTLNFTLGTVGPWLVGLKCSWTGLSGAETITKTISVGAALVGGVAVVDGQVQIPINAPISKVANNNTFSLAVADSTSTATVRQAFNYSVGDPASSIEVAAGVAAHDWTSGDSTTLVYPILGDRTGFAIGAGSEVTAGNGLTATVNAADAIVELSGPPTAFENSEVYAQIALLKAGVGVAYVTRTFTLVAHNTTTNDIGTFTCNTRPYIAGTDFVGLNPLTPYFNSPQISKQNFGNYTVRIQAGSALPQGLSLDAVTGLVYGTPLADDVPVSILEYVNSSNQVHGVVTINWDICVGSFLPTSDIDPATPAQIGVAYSGSIANTSAYGLTSATLYRGRLPLGLTLGVATGGASAVISGTPTEAGYFDVWFKLTNAQGQTAFYYQRFVSEYVAPLLITTTILAQVVTGVAYLQPMFAVGGELPYIWSIASGTLPTGISLNATSGILSGTTALTVYSAPITFEVTDSRGVSATATLTLTLDNALQIEPGVLPLIIPSQPYMYQFAAQGGNTTGGYTWTLAGGSPALPSGLSLSTSGLLSGVTTVSSYTEDIVVKVTDASSNTVSQAFALQTGTANVLLIDTTGVGPVLRGGDYQGLLVVDGLGTAPYRWSVAPDSPNPLSAVGMLLTADALNNGATATISGTTTATFANEAIKLQVIDSLGNTAYAYVFLSSYSSLKITSPFLPNGTVGGAYNYSLTASGVNLPFTWELNPGSSALPSGFNPFSSSGLLSGTPLAVSSTTPTFRVTDAIGDYAIAALPLNVSTSTLSIVNSSPLPTVTAGVAYSEQLTATGGVTPYVFSISPASSQRSLPAGLSINSSNQIVGTTTASSTYVLTFRVTDAIGNTFDKLLSMTVLPGLTLQAGPDFNNGSSTGYLGYVGSGDPASMLSRPNGAFSVVATGVVSTSASTFQATLPNGFSVTSYVFGTGAAAGTVYMLVDGPFSAGAAGDNNFLVSVNDNSVVVSALFKWKVVINNATRLAPGGTTAFPPWYFA